MGSIKQIVIHGYKKFKDFQLTFHKGLNVIIGENESGKTTIIEAVNIALNQWYRAADKSIIEELINRELLDEFYTAPSVDSLPRIVIEIEFDLSDIPAQSDYYGQEYELINLSNDLFGVSFHCELNDAYAQSLLPNINAGLVPFEYYDFSWKTFSGGQFLSLKSPVKYLAINTSEQTSNTSFNYYNKKIFSNTYSESDKLKYKSNFRDEVKNAFGAVALEDIDADKKFAIDNKRIILENILAITENGISLENKGKGRENLIKTQIALDKAKERTEVITIEEPENHLSHTTLRKMINDISENHDNKQLIVTTHNSLIVTSLGLKNVIWINNNKGTTLADIPETTADYFSRIDNSNLLQFLLAEKAILVEGATEYLMLPELYKVIYPGSSLQLDKIDIISCNGLSYKQYLEIARQTNHKVAIITDNDAKQENLDYMSAYNAENECSHVFMSCDVGADGWTWEANIYSLNKALIEDLIRPQNGAQYLFHGKDYGPYLGKMLNNKVETAYHLLPVAGELQCPQYVKDAFEWIRN
ncbi:MAG: AAA family ATPase [Porphyromonadaceae bacterium]|nr:AAA family ATPase [Porphyromonadaceae bacterium]